MKRRILNGVANGHHAPQPPGRKSSGRSKGVARALARPGDPYVLPDGRRIDPERKKVDVTSDDYSIDAKSFKTVKRRSVKELPADIGTMKPIAVVFVLAMMGLSNREIASALEVDVGKITDLRKHEAYGKVFDAIADEFINTNSSHLLSRIAAYQHDALTTLADVAINGKKEENRGRFSADLLDRGGHSARHRQDRDAMNADDLHIVITKSNGDDAVKVSIGRDAF